MTAPWFASDLEQMNVTLKQEKVAVEQEKVALKQEKDALKQEKVAVEQEKVALRQEKVAVEQEKVALKQENDALQHALTDVHRRLQNSMYLVARLQKLVASNRAMHSHTTSLFCYTVYAFIRRVTGGVGVYLLCKVARYSLWMRQEDWGGFGCAQIADWALRVEANNERPFRYMGRITWLWKWHDS